MSKPWEFEADDFTSIDMIDSRSHRHAKLANTKLKEWIALAPVVYRGEGAIALRYKGAKQTYECWTGAPEAADTTCARLICIEPIVRYTADALLKELCEVGPYGYVPDALMDIIKRARKLTGVK